MQTQWEQRYAQRTQRMKGSAIRELLKLTENPEIISFAGGMPAPEVFPTQEFAEACSRVLKNYSAQALQYGTTEGYAPLREMIADFSSRPGFMVTPDNVMITSGSQQALDLIGKIFINRGDRILVENPTYLGALQAWNAYGSEYATVASDDHGMCTDELELALRCGPKLIYNLPNFQNPSGTTMPLERRLQLVEIADRSGVPIIEDDPYGRLRFEGSHIPSVIELDSQVHQNSGGYNGNVIYLSTFSKILAPGLRLAWVIAPKEVIRKLVQAKQGCDLNTSTLNQLVAHEVSKNNFIDVHIKKIIACYHERRDVMLDTLVEFMPGEVRWTHPEGGLFLWVTLPENLSATTIFPDSIKEKVAYVPGESFFPLGGGQNTMRLNFSFSNPIQIATGIERLSRVIRSHL
jgi:2-aminoadipate transaminase